MNPIEVIPAVGLGGVFTWAAQAATAFFRTRKERAIHRDDVDATLEQHRDKLTFDLLKAAREEVAAARVEASELRSMQLRLIHFDEAIDHIEQLLQATSPEDRTAAERRAAQFLTRMKRFQEATGTMRNEAAVQIIRAEGAELDSLARKIP